MNCADAGAGKHRDDEFRNHGHIYCYPIALADVEPLENIRKAVHFPVKLLIGVCLVIAAVRLPYYCRLVACRRVHEAVEAVIGGVYLAAGEPLHLGLRKVPLQNLVPLPEPGELALRHLRPKTLCILRRPLVESFILFKAFYMGIAPEFV